MGMMEEHNGVSCWCVDVFDRAILGLGTHLFKLFFLLE